MSTKVGLEGAVYINTGTFGAPTWLLIDLTKDATVTLEKSLADLSSRASGGWRWKKAALKDFKVDLTMVYDDTDTAQAAIAAAFLSDATVDLQILDATIALSGAGFRGQFEVASYNKSEALEDGQMLDCSFELAYGSVPTVV